MRKVLWLLPLLGIGCSGSNFTSSPADFSGDYTVAVTNVSNGCQFGFWTVGQQVTGVPITVTQSGSNVTAVVSGVAALYYDTALGSATYTGTAAGDQLSLTIDGNKQFPKGNCTYTVIATLKAKLTGDSLSGTIDYTAATNGASDCPPLGSCASAQKFNGSRPPKQ